MLKFIRVLSILFIFLLIVTSPAQATSNTLLIDRFLYNGSVTYGSSVSQTEGDEYVKICNVSPGSISLDGYKVGDEETKSDPASEGMYFLPNISLASGQCILIVRRAPEYLTRFSAPSDGTLFYEFASNGVDDPSVPNLAKYTSWSTGDFSLRNAGDEVVLLDSNDYLVDGVCYGTSPNAFNGVAPSIFADGCSGLSVGDGEGLKRTSSVDTDSFTDFGNNPTAVELLDLGVQPAPLTTPGIAALGLALSAICLLVFRRRKMPVTRQKR